MTDFERSERLEREAPNENAGPAVEVPLEALTEDALNGVIDSFIFRDGTDYGVHEASIEKKRQDIRSQLSKGRIKIVFDPGSESVTLMTEQQWRKQQSSQREV